MGGLRSQRMTVLLTPEAKDAIEVRAASLGITASELARRAIESYEPEHDAAALQALAEELSRVVEATEAKVDAACAELAAMRRYFAELAELDASGGSAGGR